jgi:hypothetical protein
MKNLGSGNAFKFSQKRFRDRVLAHGAPISVGKHGLASMLTDTCSCPNPPTDDCTNGIVPGLVGRHQIEIFLHDYPPTNPGAQPTPGNDDPEDRAQQDRLEAG